jgi:FkbM family methyltransferase
VAAALSVVLAACGASQEAPAESGQPAPGAPATVEIACPVRGEFGPASGYFSQFYEDYILAYVFEGVQKGVYVDVGANDPDTANLTKYFYEKGWRGINIEPIPELAASLETRRPGDVNLGIGISDRAGTLTFYRSEHSGLSTFDPAVMKRHSASGIKFDTFHITVATLTDVFDTHPVVQDGVAFLNADVEGFEKQVFSGLDFTRYQPHVILAEATAPLTELPTHQVWEPILLEAGYIFAMDDGLNRYYVHASQQALLPRFLEADYCVGRDKLAKQINLDGFMPRER